MGRGVSYTDEALIDGLQPAVDYTVAEWSEITGIHEKTIRFRLPRLISNNRIKETGTKPNHFAEGGRSPKTYQIIATANRPPLFGPRNEIRFNGYLWTPEEWEQFTSTNDVTSLLAQLVTAHGGWSVDLADHVKVELKGYIHKLERTIRILKDVVYSPELNSSIPGERIEPIAYWVNEVQALFGIENWEEEHNRIVKQRSKMPDYIAPDQEV